MNQKKVKEICEKLELLRQERFHIEAKNEEVSKSWNVKYNRALNELIRECGGGVIEPQKIFAEKVKSKRG